MKRMQFCRQLPPRGHTWASTIGPPHGWGSGLPFPTVRHDLSPMIGLLCCRTRRLIHWQLGHYLSRATASFRAYWNKRMASPSSHLLASLPTTWGKNTDKSPGTLLEGSSHSQSLWTWSDLSSGSKPSALPSWMRAETTAYPASHRNLLWCVRFDHCCRWYEIVLGSWTGWTFYYSIHPILIAIWPLWCIR